MPQSAMDLTVKIDGEARRRWDVLHEAYLDWGGGGGERVGLEA
jgi:hypothetical protein